MKLLGKYQNGNYTVRIFDDGTKIRETKAEVFIPIFPESIDLKITNYCDMGCLHCYEDSTPNGQHANLDANLVIRLIDSIHPYTEIAIGGGNPLSHPQLIPFLTKLESKNIIANITVNQNHFMTNQALIRYLISNDLIKGLGVSLVKVTDEFINLVKQYSNVVIHIINGVISLDELRKLYNKNLKILILGYKEIGRGRTYYSSDVENNKKQFYQNITEIIKGFRIISFDNLAIKQLGIKRILTEKDWNEFYMGDDGQFTMYIDLTKGEFAANSISGQRYKMLDNIIDMFNIVRKGVVV